MAQRSPDYYISFRNRYVPGEKLCLTMFRQLSGQQVCTAQQQPISIYGLYRDLLEKKSDSDKDLGAGCEGIHLFTYIALLHFF